MSVDRPLFAALMIWDLQNIYNMFTNEKLNIKQINVVTTNMSQNFEIWFSKKCESSWKNLWYLVANEPLLWIKALSWWSEDMDWQHNWSALSLSRLTFFLDSNFKIWLVFIVPLFANYFCVYENIFCKSWILFRFAFNVFHNNIFDIRIVFSTCFLTLVWFCVQQNAIHSTFLLKK